VIQRASGKGGAVAGVRSVPMVPDDCESEREFREGGVPPLAVLATLPSLLMVFERKETPRRIDLD